MSGLNGFGAVAWPDEFSRSPPSRLDADLVYVVGTSLSDATGAWAQLLAVLSPSERAQQARYLLERSRVMFTLSRGFRRLVLGAYLGADPRELQFSEGPHGKPSVSASQNSTDLRFNVSHSGQCVLIALSRGRELGVDIELQRANVDVERIGRRFFSVREQSELFALPKERLVDAFFACWTRKEAFIKAIGAGLSFPLASFDVEVDPARPAQLFAVRDSPTEAKRWSALDLPSPMGYRAALIAEGTTFAAHPFRWP